MIPELNLLVAGSSDNALKIFKLEQVGTAIQCNFKATLKKDSGARVLEMAYEKNLRQLLVLSADNKLEAIKVNVDNKDSIMKKLLRTEKRKTLKRKRDEAEDDDAVPDVKIDKDDLQKALESGSYDLSLHFSKKLAFDLGQKAKTFTAVPVKSKTSDTVLKIFVGFHSNQVHQYKYELSNKDGPEVEKVFGALESHKLAIRGV